MSETLPEADPLHPFSFELVPSNRQAGGYHWAIREKGKVIQRSETALVTEAKARKQALAMIERLRIGQMNW